MLKYFVLIINSFAILIFNTFFGDGVSVDAKFPASATPGSEFPVEVTIKKGTTSGFAKLQIDLPAGLSAKEADSKGGSFTFSNQSVKYIWTALPGDEEFTIKFTVMVDASASGLKTVQGKFSYIVNNVKQQVDIAPQEINLGGTAVATNSSTTSTVTTEPAATATVIPSNTTTTTENPTSFNKPVEPATAVSCIRSIKSAGDQYEVEIKVKKGSVKGFAKLTENIPAGLTASAGKTSGSSFTFGEGHAKFVWVSLPADDELIVSYRISVKQKPAVNPVITGEFSYLENEQTQKVKLASDEINLGVSAEPIATNTTTPATTPTNTVTETTTPAVTPTTTVATTNVNPVNTETTTPAVTPTNTTTPVVSNRSGNVNYVVQIGAYRKAIDVSSLASRFGISENIRTDMHEGFTKCLVGTFGDYRGARDHRESIKNKGVSDAFVAAYSSGKRITVQEALMISNQKWFR